jgi:hypothetical protein
MAQATKVPVYSDAVLKKGFVKGPAGISVEQAKAQMEAAKEPVSLTRGTFTPKHLDPASPRLATRGQGGNSPRVAYTPAEIADANDSLQSASQISLPATPAPAIPARTAAQPLQPAAPVATQPAAKESAPQSPISHHETFEDVEFTVETYKDNRDRKWYGIVNYKPDVDGNQPGEERFVANTQGELNLKLLKGKANATLKVRNVVRGRKMSGKPELKETHDLEILRLNNLTIPEFNALPEKSKILLRENAYAKEVLAFQDQNPQYRLSSEAGVKNLQAVVGYVIKQGWPITTRNLQNGWDDLEAANKLEVAEPSEVVSVTPAVFLPPVPPAPVTPIRKRGSSALVPGASSGSWANGIDDDGPRAQQAANANQNTGMTPERVKELSKTSEGMAQLKREMRSGFKPQTPSYRG